MTKQLKDEFGFSTPGASLHFFGTQQTPGLKTLKAELFISGIPVHGALLSKHTFDSGTHSFTGDMPSSNFSEATPKITPSQALAISSLYSTNPIRSAPVLKYLPSSDAARNDLVWWIDYRSTDVENPGTQVIINAMSGQVIGSLSSLHTVKETKVYNAHESGIAIGFTASSGKAPVRASRDVRSIRSASIRGLLEEGSKRYFNIGFKQLRDNRVQPEVDGCDILELVDNQKWKITRKLKIDDCVATIKGKNEIGAKACQIISAADGSFISITPPNCEVYAVDGKVVGHPDASADAATDNSNAVYEYFSDRFGRRSYDGTNSVLRSVVKVGLGFNNAAWISDLGFMVYGFGDGENMGDFTKLVDIAGHEMTHGVVDTTAKLTMMDEPGAVNEATADYFGLQISRTNNWIMGEHIYLKDPKRIMRSLWKPSDVAAVYMNSRGEKVTRPYPEKYSQKFRIDSGEQCGGDNDRCFVHFNSTILSHGYWWINSKLGKSKTEDIVFRALVHYYRPNTGFKEAGKALRQACVDLHGSNDPSTCKLVDEALRNVEI
ncbi:MAG: M4 family metallopeptidase [Cryobacterium sp.]|nr:M4 family metallopeptidase [Oligoflexia bacterium]